MICFQPNGMLQTKKYICSCSKCLEGIATECLYESGGEIQVKSACNNNEDDSDYEHNYYEEYDDYEQHDLQGDVASICLSADVVIALFSPPISPELFYLCKVINFAVALEQLSYIYNHIIKKSEKYIKEQYFQK